MNNYDNLILGNPYSRCQTGCPCCKSQDIEIKSGTYCNKEFVERTEYWATCGDCGLKGPDANSEEEAIEYMMAIVFSHEDKIENRHSKQGLWEYRKEIKSGRLNNRASR